MTATTSKAVAVVAFALLLGLQPVTTDLYLPALPQLSTELSASMSSAQLTLSVLIACFGFAQLAWGPVADRVGRRRVLLIGLSLYAVAALLAASAPSIGLLVGARALQGVGLASAVVCARAMVRDLYEPVEAARVMSQALTGLGVIALAAPLGGGFVAAAFGWRTALLCTALFAAGTLALVVLRLPETAPALNRDATRLGALLSNYGRIASTPSFRAWTLLVTFTYGGLYAFLAGSSFVYITGFGIGRQAYGTLLAASSVSYIAGTFACRRWLVIHGIRGAVARGGIITAAGALLYALPALAGLHGVATLIVAQVLYTFGHGIHQPCAQAGVVGPFPAHAGAAAALSGFVLALGAFATGAWLGLTLDGGVPWFALTIAGFGFATTTTAWTLVQRHGDPATARRVAAVAPARP